MHWGTQDASGRIRMQKDAKGCNLVGAHKFYRHEIFNEYLMMLMTHFFQNFAEGKVIRSWLMTRRYDDALRICSSLQLARRTSHGVRQLVVKWGWRKPGHW